jgi:Raf kinase inhibitor-like YbhB/YbcL family protein
MRLMPVLGLALLAAFPIRLHAAELEVTSPAFLNGEKIPAKYTCDDQNVSPPFQWKGLPEGVQSIALIAEDPDAPGKTWVHWVLYNLPPTISDVPENIPPLKQLPACGWHGTNDFGSMGYSGPCPPSGSHRYHFKLYALDTILNLEPGASKAQVLKAAQGHILAEAQVTGVYQRKGR